MSIARTTGIVSILTKSFFQQPIKPSDRWKTTFVTPLAEVDGNRPRDLRGCCAETLAFIQGVHHRGQEWLTVSTMGLISTGFTTARSHLPGKRVGNAGWKSIRPTMGPLCIGSEPARSLNSILQATGTNMPTRPWETRPKSASLSTCCITSAGRKAGSVLSFANGRLPSGSLSSLYRIWGSGLSSFGPGTPCSSVTSRIPVSKHWVTTFLKLL